MIELPAQVERLINELESNGFEAYAVGGGVRDSIVGKEPHDWDIATNATPDDVMKVFSDYPIITTGIAHGTLTVKEGLEFFEITTYRKDGAYSDHRHPSNVVFTPALAEDLMRRDFTINAMAFHTVHGLFDPYGGQEDIKNQIVRCVGDPDMRFREDALRILRAIRFAAELGYEVENNTKEAILSNAHLLTEISAERIQTEFIRILLAEDSWKYIDQYKDVIAVFIPEIKPMFSCEQNNPHHIYNVWLHTICALQHTPCDLITRLAVLLHDIGKPRCLSFGTDDIAHFYGHNSESSDMTWTILRRMRFDKDTCHRVVELVLCHDVLFEPEGKMLKRWLNRLGPEQLTCMFDVQFADISAQNPADFPERSAKLELIRETMAEILKANQCFSLKNLAINGRDLSMIGIAEGVMVGKILDALLAKVISEKIANEKQALLTEAKRMMIKGIKK